MYKFRAMILLLLLSGCYYVPSDGTPAPPEPVNPDLQGVALEAYQAVQKADKKPEELNNLIAAIKLTVTKSGALGWDFDRMNQEFLESTKAAFGGDSTAPVRWREYDQWQTKTLKPITDKAELIYTLNQIVEGLEAARD